MKILYLGLLAILLLLSLAGCIPYPFEPINPINPPEPEYFLGKITSPNYQPPTEYLPNLNEHPTEGKMKPARNYNHFNNNPITP